MRSYRATISKSKPKTATTQPSRKLVDQPVVHSELYQSLLFAQFQLSDAEGHYLTDLQSSLSLTIHSTDGLLHFSRFLFLATWPTISITKFTPLKSYALSSLFEQENEFMQKYSIIPPFHFSTIPLYTPSSPHSQSSSQSHFTTLLASNQHQFNQPNPQLHPHQPQQPEIPIYPLFPSQSQITADTLPNQLHTTSNILSTPHNPNGSLLPPLPTTTDSSTTNNNNELPRATLHHSFLDPSTNLTTDATTSLNYYQDCDPSQYLPTLQQSVQPFKFPHFHPPITSQFAKHTTLLSNTIYKSFSLEDTLEEPLYTVQRLHDHPQSLFSTRFRDFNAIVLAYLPCGFFLLRIWTHIEALRIKIEQIQHETQIYHKMFPDTTHSGPQSNLCIHTKNKKRDENDEKNEKNDNDDNNDDKDDNNQSAKSELIFHNPVQLLYNTPSSTQYISNVPNSPSHITDVDHFLTPSSTQPSMLSQTIPTQAHNQTTSLTTSPAFILNQTGSSSSTTATTMNGKNISPILHQPQRSHAATVISHQQHQQSQSLLHLYQLYYNFNIEFNTIINDIYSWLYRNPVLVQLLEDVVYDFINSFDSIHTMPASTVSLPTPNSSSSQQTPDPSFSGLNFIVTDQNNNVNTPNNTFPNTFISQQHSSNFINKSLNPPHHSTSTHSQHDSSHHPSHTNMTFSTTTPTLTPAHNKNNLLSNDDFQFGNRPDSPSPTGSVSISTSTATANTLQCGPNGASTPGGLRTSHGSIASSIGSSMRRRTKVSQYLDINAQQHSRSPSHSISGISSIQVPFAIPTTTTILPLSSTTSTSNGARIAHTAAHVNLNTANSTHFQTTTLNPSGTSSSSQHIHIPSQPQTIALEATHVSYIHDIGNTNNNPPSTPATPATPSQRSGQYITQLPNTPGNGRNFGEQKVDLAEFLQSPTATTSSNQNAKNNPFSGSPSSLAQKSVLNHDDIMHTSNNQIDPNDHSEWDLTPSRNRQSARFSTLPVNPATHRTPNSGHRLNDNTLIDSDITLNSKNAAVVNTVASSNQNSSTNNSILSLLTLNGSMPHLDSKQNTSFAIPEEPQPPPPPPTIGILSNLFLLSPPSPPPHIAQSPLFQSGLLHILQRLAEEHPLHPQSTSYNDDYCNDTSTIHSTFQSVPSSSILSSNRPFSSHTSTVSSSSSTPSPLPQTIVDFSSEPIFTHLASMSDFITTIFLLQLETFAALLPLHQFWYLFQSHFLTAVNHARVFEYLDLNDFFYGLVTASDPYTNKTSNQNNAIVAYVLQLARMQQKAKNLISNSKIASLCHHFNSPSAQTALHINNGNKSTSHTFGFEKNGQNELKSNTATSQPLDVDKYHFEHIIGGLDIQHWISVEKESRIDMLSLFYLPPSFNPPPSSISLLLQPAHEWTQNKYYFKTQKDHLSLPTSSLSFTPHKSQNGLYSSSSNPNSPSKPANVAIMQSTNNNSSDNGGKIGQNTGQTDSTKPISLLSYYRDNTLFEQGFDVFSTSKPINSQNTDIDSDYELEFNSLSSQQQINHNETHETHETHHLVQSLSASPFQPTTPRKGQNQQNQPLSNDTITTIASYPNNAQSNDPYFHNQQLEQKPNLQIGIYYPQSNITLTHVDFDPYRQTQAFSLNFDTLYTPTCTINLLGYNGENGANGDIFLGNSPETTQEPIIAPQVIPPSIKQPLPHTTTLLSTTSRTSLSHSHSQPLSTAFNPSFETPIHPSQPLPNAQNSFNTLYIELKLPDTGLTGFYPIAF